MLQQLLREIWTDKPGRLATLQTVYYPYIPHSTGYLDNVLSIFDQHDHPFVLVGQYGMQWAGVNYIGRPEIDILVRSSQIQAITSDLVNSGEWKRLRFSPYADVSDEIFHYIPGSLDDIWLEVTGDRVLCPYMGLRYLRLWPEEVYKLSVDGCSKLEVPDISPNNCVVLEDEYLRDPDKLIGPPLLKKKKRFPEDFDTRALLAVEHRAKWHRRDVPIFVPLIAEFLNAHLEQFQEHHEFREEFELGIGSRAGNALRLFIRYLYLDWDIVRDWLLENKIKPEYRDVMRGMCDSYFRKPVPSSCNCKGEFRVVFRPTPWEGNPSWPRPCGCPDPDVDGK